MIEDVLGAGSSWDDGIGREIDGRERSYHSNALENIVW